MKFICSKEIWKRGIDAVQNAVGSPISNPIVENILLECKESQAIFTATNLNLVIRCECPVEVAEEGKVALPTKVISNVVHDLPNGDVTFDCRENRVEIVCGRFNAKLMGCPAEQFPPFVGIDEGVELTVPADDFKTVIRRTIFCTTAEKSRFELDGLKWVGGPDGVKVIGTDGRRLACIERDWKASGEISSLVPSKTLHEALSSLPDVGEVALRISERKVMISCADICMSSNLLVDNFPPYERIIPKESLQSATIERESLLGAVRRAANLANLETNMLTLQLKENSIAVVGERQEVGGLGMDEIEAKYEGQEISVYYNHRFLSDVLRVLESDEILFEFWDATRPGVIRPMGEEGYVYVIMPMRPPEKEGDDPEETEADEA